MPASAFDSLITEVATAYDLPANLLKAQVQHESSFDPNAFRYEHDFFIRYLLNKPDAHSAAFGPLGACSYGLLQVLLETAMEEGFGDRPERLFIPRVGLTFGAKHLSTLWNRVGRNPTTYRLALARYNGIGTAADQYAATIYQIAGVPL